MLKGNKYQVLSWRSLFLTPWKHNMLRDKLTQYRLFYSSRDNILLILFIQLCQVNNQFIQTEKFVWTWIVGKFVFCFQAMNKKSEGLGHGSSKVWRTEWPEILIQSFIGEMSLKEIDFKWITFFYASSIFHILSLSLSNQRFFPESWSSALLFDFLFLSKGISTQQWIRTSIPINKRYHLLFHKIITFGIFPHGLKGKSSFLWYMKTKHPAG